MRESLTVEMVGRVAIITFDRPPHNSATELLLRTLAENLEALDADAACRAVVLQSNGKVFCAGADLKPPSDTLGDASGAAFSDFYVQAVRLHATRKPIVVAVQGAAIGAGLGLALIGDFCVAAEEARFSANFVKLGFHPGFALSDTLPRLIGMRKARLMLLTGRRIDAQTALAYGLIDQITTAGKLRDEALALATEIAGNAPLAVQATRSTLRANLVNRLRVQTDHECVEQTRLMLTDDFVEGLSAVAERRPAIFRGQ